MIDVSVVRVVIFDPDGEEWARAEDVNHAQGMVQAYGDGLDGWTYRLEEYSHHSLPRSVSDPLPLFP